MRKVGQRTDEIFGRRVREFEVLSIRRERGIGTEMMSLDVRDDVVQGEKDC